VRDHAVLRCAKGVPAGFGSIKRTGASSPMRGSQSVGAPHKDRLMARLTLSRCIGYGAGKIIDGRKGTHFIAPGLGSAAVHSLQKPGRDRAFDHISTHDDKGDAQVVELGTSGAQRLLTRIFTCRHGLVWAAHTSVRIEVSHVPGHEYNSRATRHEWKRKIRSPKRRDIQFDSIRVLTSGSDGQQL